MQLYKLKELYSIASGLSKPASQFGYGNPFLSFSVVFNNYHIPSTLIDLVNTSPVEVRRFSIKRGDVFVTRTSEKLDELGKSCVALQNYEKATFNGFCKRLRPIVDENIILPEYAQYLFRSKQFTNQIIYSCPMSTRASLNEEILNTIVLNIHSLSEQQHIVDIIGSIDDKIENNNKILEKTDKLGVIKYKLLNDTFDEFCNFAIFKKGKEALSQNYTEENNNDNINFIRVKDLNSLTNTYIPKNLNIPIANPSDILISFDGAIGRINYGLYGAYSSGIYKVIPCFKNNYGILYWALKDNYNQHIMLEHTNGTTILHGAKAISYLKIKKHSSKDIDFYNNIFNYSLNIKLENIKLNILKQLYLKKFFR